MLIRSFGVLSALLMAFLVSEARGAHSTMEKSEEVIGRTVSNYRLESQDGRFFPLHSLKGKYSLVSFIYTTCPGPCLAISQSLSDLLRKMDPKIAGSVRALSITIDSLNDSTSKLREYGRDYTGDFSRWTFARTDEETLRNISADLGFFYEKKGNASFEHMNRLTLVGPDMRIITHFYGVEFNPAEVEEAIKASMEGRSVRNKLKDVMDYALVFCSNYDPVTGTYKLDYKYWMVVLFQDFLALATVVYLLRHKFTYMFSWITGGRIKSAS